VGLTRARLTLTSRCSRPERRSRSTGEQLRLYALMWWRSTGDLPATIELRYGAHGERWPLTEAELVSAAATLGPHCSGCGVRQLCDGYWESKANEGGGKGARVDVEVVVQSVMNRGGFIGREPGGREIAVVCEEDVAAMHEPFVVGERVRIVNAQREGDGSAVQITRPAEVFRVG